MYYEDLTDDDDRQLSSVVEELFTKRKLSTEDENQLMTSRQIDDIIQVRCGSADDDIDDADDATVAKQPVMTSATDTNRLVLIGNINIVLSSVCDSSSESSQVVSMSFRSRLMMSIQFFLVRSSFHL